ncbi:hypothetical protein QBC33DRAFT_581742 [Phialemonium atrogriseum]|uniref:Heterokaryon incompatibility domain-containing protein n=1 Tax=Phialemonium atrogriseum TaxID=1093897 RepID=A0AAJ0FCU2_9PEZI|nr:uncharacterized protein QBC33DRAFT_581742 [Phialemonium atrogriseum]KAK1762477.1 hypothetical protein QBC33DRAFT_581742 [Phialemonium atrogriseum]
MTLQSYELKSCTFHVAADSDTPAADSGDVPHRYFDCTSLNDCAELIRTWSAGTMNHDRCSRDLSGHKKIDSSSSPLPKRSSYQERLSGTGFGGLSKLFQDLFELAALLGIKYAWIDSLCIIQDVADDWKEESLKMSDYYQNAEFTVSAINIPQIDGLKISQQHLLLESLPMARLPYHNRQGGQNASMGLEFYNTEGVYSAWEDIVEQYCKLKLSRPQEDRIIALGGVATEFQKALHIKDDCVAGLWRRDLHQGLLWEKSYPGTPRRFDNFPTWTWASIDTPASAAAEADATTIQLPNSIESTSSDRRHVEGNFVLHALGRLQPVLIGSYFQDEASFYLATDVTGHPARSIGAEKQQAVVVPGERNIIAGWASLEHPEFQDDAAFSPGPVILALLVSTKRVSAGAFGLGFVLPIHQAFLVLFLRRSDKVMDGFERVGVGRLFGREAARGFELAIERDIRLI